MFSCHFTSGSHLQLKLVDPNFNRAFFFSLPPDPAGKMAVCKRPFNSTSPFCGLSKGDMKGSSYSADQETEEDDDDEERKGGSKMKYIDLLLIKKVMTHGTAELVGEMPVKTSIFVAQAEGKVDFCPNDSLFGWQRASQTAHVLR